MEDEHLYKWEEITEDLYSKINLTGGKLFSKISTGSTTFESRNWIDNIWVEIYMNDFTYIDPFYGETTVNSKFETFFELYDVVTDHKFDSILKIEKLEFQNENEMINGSFSNSLDFLVRRFKFGEINNWEIDVEIEYSLANSDSYGCMTGTVKDHLTKSAIIKTKLEVNQLELECPNDQDPFEAAKHLNWEIYNPELVRPALDLNWSSEFSKGYTVPYRKVEERSKIENPFPFRKAKPEESNKSNYWKFWKNN